PPAGRSQLHQGAIKIVEPEIVARSWRHRDAIVPKSRLNLRLVVIAQPERIVIKPRRLRRERLRYCEITIAELEKECFTRRRPRLRPQRGIAQNRRIEQSHVECRRSGDIRHTNVDMVERERLHHRPLRTGAACAAIVASSMSAWRRETWLTARVGSMSPL